MMVMINAELVRRSPIRSLERSIDGGLGRGNIGLVASRKGVGKTACLVHIATDKLLQGKPVIHVSYAARVDHIIAWYEEILKELSRKKGMKAAADFHDEIVRNRVIMNFNQDGARTEQVLRSLEAMIVHGKFAADTLIVDGFDFAQGAPDDVRRFKEFAGRLGLEVWFSVSLKGEDPLFEADGVPTGLRDYVDAADVLISLRHEGEEVRLDLVKARGLAKTVKLRLRLDPKTLLIARK
jgi:KaiC/GvpD/RAD55 family RecA-like ATPase